MKRIFIFAVLVLFPCVNLSAQGYTPSDEFAINIDYARFSNDEESGYLELYYGLFPFLLTYHSSEGEFKAGAKLITKLRNNETGEFNIDEHTTLPVSITDTSGTSFKYPFITQSGHIVPLGKYTLKIVAIDSLNPSRKDSIIFPIDISQYGNEIITSDLEFCRRIKSSKEKQNPFYKNSLEVVPNPTLIFGVTANPILYHYLEVYNLDPEKKYTLKKQIVNTGGKVVRKSSKSRQFGVENAVEVGMENMTTVLSGKYMLTLKLFDQSSDLVAKTDKMFFVYNPHLQDTARTSPTFQADKLNDLTDKELKEEFQQAAYLATDHEKDLFKQLDTEVGKRQFLKKFWLKVAKGRKGNPPILRPQYLNRIKIANERFDSISEDGWETDRGRVFLLYGEPDEIDRHPSVRKSKPNEIWHYHSIENGVIFVFIDRYGFGNYELVHSTKRGELRDDEWRRFLR